MTTTKHIRQERRCRTTGTTVQVWDLSHAESPVGIDGGNRWGTVCVEHGGFVSHPTLSLACDHAPHPEGWCEWCMGPADRTMMQIAETVASYQRGIEQPATQPSENTGLPEHLSMWDPTAERLWQIARRVHEHERIAGFTTRGLANLEFEEWEWMIRSADSELTSGEESAVAALVVAMRAAR